MPARERWVTLASAVLFLAAAAAIAALAPMERHADLPLIVALTLAYALIMRVKFEFGDLFVAPEQLILVPVILLCPLPYVPIVVAVAGAISMVPDALGGSVHRDRWLVRLSDSWFCLGPVLVLAWLAPGEPSLAHAEVYVLALVAQLVFDLVWVLIRNFLLDNLPLREVLRDIAGTAGVDVILSPVALMFAVPAADQPLCC